MCITVPASARRALAASFEGVLSASSEEGPVNHGRRRLFDIEDTQNIGQKPGRHS